MYLRPRFGKYHRRAPSDPEEPARVRNEIYATLAAYLEPLALRAELTDAGSSSVAGRATRVVKIKTAPQARKAAAQEHLHRKWREGTTVESVEGEIAVDKETGVALRATVSGRLAFVRRPTSSKRSVRSTR
jgi:hypothetical protein